MYFETLGIFSTYVKCSDYLSFIISILNSYCYGRWLIRLIILNQFTYLYIYMEINQLSEHKKKNKNKAKQNQIWQRILFDCVLWYRELLLKTRSNINLLCIWHLIIAPYWVLCLYIAVRTDVQEEYERIEKLSEPGKLYDSWK